MRQRDDCKKSVYEFTTCGFNDNPEALLALQYIRETDHSVFLTGKAGSGKTTLLKQLLEDSPKRFVVTAPTGVAAINARGVTLHSFFQMPLSPYVPGHELYGHVQLPRINRERLSLLRSLELLIIDEISMVRADTLDRVDHLLRLIRRNSAPFGGVQLMMIGDLFQLSPVIKPDEQALLDGVYATPFFFSAHVFQDARFVTIALKKIYRQNDQKYIHLLNQIRHNCVTSSTLKLLNDRVIPKTGTGLPKSGSITLTTHNKMADGINDAALSALKGSEKSFRAVICDEYPLHAFPAPELLSLKPGAQVMFVRNDSSPNKRFYNGKIGTINRINAEHLEVLCEQDGEPETLTVKREVWENIRYTLNAETSNIDTEVIGTFSQFPVRLAWAITIHKSQGLTFEKATIDAQSAFASGQVYVALSRCRALSGVSLSAPIPAYAIKTDACVVDFERRASSHPPSETTLRKAQVQFQQRLINDFFNFSDLVNAIHKIGELLKKHESVLQLTQKEPLDCLSADFSRDVSDVAEKFQRELMRHYLAQSRPQENAILQSRIVKAVAYFLPHCKRVEQWCEQCHIDAAPKNIRHAFQKALDEVWRLVHLSSTYLCSCESGFDREQCLRARATADIEWQRARTRPIQRNSQMT